MSVNVIGGNQSSVRWRRNVGAAGGRESQPVRHAAPETAASHEVRGLEPSAAVLPSEPPAGTDPELWSVLTSEERAFYARTHALGPLTYGLDESRSVSGALARGGRLDLRV